MRTSVKVKNVIAKILMGIGFLFILGTGCSIDIGASFTELAITMVIGSVLTILGWELLKW